jgi:C-terminal processing protease CtpA/Prc
MQHSLLLSTAAAALFGAVGGAPVAVAQPGSAAEQSARAQALSQYEQQRVQAETLKEQARVQAAQFEETQKAHSALAEEMAAAQKELEDAARKVATLSGQRVEPIVRDFERRFRYTGQRAMLGVNIEDTERGARIAGVSPGGPAAEAGLKVGDTIIAIDGADIAAPRSAAGASQSPTELLLAQMTNVDPGDSVKLRVLAESGTERDVTIQARQVTAETFTRLPGFAVLPKAGRNLLSFNGPGSFVFFGGNPWSDMQLVTLTPELGAYFGTTKGVLVVRGPGNDTLRLQDGDVILDIGGREPTTPEHALRILASFQPGETLKITIMRKQRRETLEFKLPDEAASRG